LKYLNFLDTARVDEFFDHTGMTHQLLENSVRLPFFYEAQGRSNEQVGHTENC
jgi:hypothetical protein